MLIIRKILLALGLIPSSLERAELEGYIEQCKRQRDALLLEIDWANERIRDGG